MKQSAGKFKMAVLQHGDMLERVFNAVDKDKSGCVLVLEREREREGDVWVALDVRDHLHML